MPINVFHGIRLENLSEKPEPHARQHALLRKIWSAPYLSRCAPEKNIEHPALVQMRPWSVFFILEAISSKSI